MEEEMVLVEVFFKSGRRTKRVFSFVSRRDSEVPVPSNIWAMIENGVEKEFGCGVTHEQLSIRFTELH